jgi:antitoxin YefM
MEALMKAMTYSDARQHLAKTMDSVCNDHDAVIITRKNNSHVVLLSLEDYESLKETAYLLKSPKNAMRLLKAIEEVDLNKLKEKELIDETSLD